MKYGMTICKSRKYIKDDGYCWSVGEYTEQVNKANDFNQKSSIIRLKVEEITKERHDSISKKLSKL